MSLADQAELVADAWRILGKLGLVDTVFNHISIVSPDAQGKLQLIMNPNYLLPSQLRSDDLRIIPLKQYDEVEAEKLCVNPDGLQLHSLIHTTRMKSGVVVHTHSVNCIAVGCSEQGLLPLSQTSIEFANASEIIEYTGAFRTFPLNEQMKKLAITGGAALLRNHGALIIADTIPEAVYLAYYLEEACRIQVITLSQGVSYILPSTSAVERTFEVLNRDRSKVAGLLFNALRNQLQTTKTT